MFEDINMGLSGKHGRAHDPNSFSYSDGSTDLRRSAKKVDSSSKRNGPELPEQGRQDPGAACTFTATGLTMAHSQEVLRIDPKCKQSHLQSVGLSWWEFRPGSSRSAKIK